jgi:hypothetical protein
VAPDEAGEAGVDCELVVVTVEESPRVSAGPGVAGVACPLRGCAVPLSGICTGRSFSQAVRVSTNTKSTGIAITACMRVRFFIDAPPRITSIYHTIISKKVNTLYW